MSTADVSHLVPTCDRSALPRPAVASALAQMHADVRVLVPNDASTAVTPVVMAELAADPCVEYVRQLGRLMGAGGREEPVLIYRDVWLGAMVVIQ